MMFARMDGENQQKIFSRMRQGFDAAEGPRRQTSPKPRAAQAQRKMSGSQRPLDFNAEPRDRMYVGQLPLLAAIFGKYWADQTFAVGLITQAEQEIL